MELILAKPSSQEISKVLPGLNEATFSPEHTVVSPLFPFGFAALLK